MMTNDDNFTPKNAIFFNCIFCDFKCYKNIDWQRHILTRKHQNNDKMMTNDDIFTPKNATTNIYTCECGKQYKHRQGLSVHKKKCEMLNKNIENIKEKDEDNKIEEIKEIMRYLMKENSEMKSLMMEVIKNGTINNSTSTNIVGNTTNSHNKAFNLNFFLNETCKDAMNIGEFVDSLKLQLSDLEKVGENGYIEGISSIIVKNLKELDITKRPLHCTDKKRETVYIKDENKWEKDEDKTQMHKLIKRVVSKNMKMFEKYREAHPDCQKYHSKYSDQYHKIVYESMGGKGDNDFEKNEKIIKNVLKEVVVDKNI
jgi:hypothetical protein